MKVELNDIRLGLSSFGEECMAGVLEKNSTILWKHKINIHNDFLNMVVNCWKNKSQIIIQGDMEYEISIKATKIKLKQCK